MNADLNKKPKLAFGQVWKNTMGGFVEIVGYDASNACPWEGSDGNTYKDEGRYRVDGTRSSFDLVELVRGVQVQTESGCSQQGLSAVLNNHKAICLHFKHTDEFLELKYSSAKELDDCIVFYGTNCTPGWGSTSVFYKSEIVCMHFAEEGTDSE